MLNLFTQNPQFVPILAGSPYLASSKKEQTNNEMIQRFRQTLMENRGSQIKFLCPEDDYWKESTNSLINKIGDIEGLETKGFKKMGHDDEERIILGFNNYESNNYQGIILDYFKIFL